MIKLLIAGDFCPQDRVAQYIEKGDYNSIFDEVKACTSQMDYSIVNLEAPVISSIAKPIEKCGPNLKCSSKAVEALKWAGFNMVTLANNHFYDYGDSGVKDTLEACKKEGIMTVGGGMNLHEASQTAYVNINNVKLAFINCCEHEFSIATENTGGSNPLNPIQQYYAIQEAKKNADKVIVIVHGGHEHYQLPSPRMKETYRFFVDAGADAVINHHQHCYSGYEVYNEKPIFYGLGNFCFDRAIRRNCFWNEGYIVILCMNDETVKFELIPYFQGNENARVEILKDRSIFDAKISELNITISNDCKLKSKHQKWMSQTSNGYILALEPYQNRLLTSLYIKGLLPSFIKKKKKKLRLITYLECEAHRERLINALNNI